MGNLVISRTIGEAVLIGESVVTVLSVSKGSRIRLGIKSPRHLTILRDELIFREAKAKFLQKHKHEFSFEKTLNAALRGNQEAINLLDNKTLLLVEGAKRGQDPAI